ncbi:MAG: hypothetical protein RBS38_02600 [Bacteroidales bacterium]|jgi:hypothetical protein|nr:hypothetical protein [Bacteroidales bacterium]
MQNINSIAELKNSIQSLEVEQTVKGKLLKEEFYTTVERFKPANLIANTLNSIEKSPYLIENILGAAMGLVTGFYSNKLIFNARGNKLKKLIGVVLQFGVTNLVARNQGTVRSIGQVIFNHLVRKKRMNSIKP